MLKNDERKHLNKKSKFYTYYKSYSSYQKDFKSNSSFDKDNDVRSKDSILPFYILFNDKQKHNNNLINFNDLTTFEKILLFMLTLLGSVQLGLFIKYFDFVNEKNYFFNGLNFYLKILIILLWKFQIILLFFLIYFFYYSLLYQNEFSEINQYDKNSSLNISLFSYYLDSSSLCRAIELTFQGNLIYSILSLIQSYVLMISAYSNYFGLCYLLNSLFNFIPFYSGSLISKDLRNKKKVFLIFSLVLTILGLIFLFSTINNSYSFFILICLFFVSFLSQKINQKYYYEEFQNESPFNLIFSNYLNYTIMLSIIISLYCLYMKKFYIFLFFGWLTNIKLFTYAIIDFGLLGAIYLQLVIFTSFSNKKIQLLKFLKYFEIYICDLFGTFIFKKYNNPFYNVTYFFGLTQCSLGMVILDYINEIKTILKKYL